jgi:hypothetical protein
LFFLDIPAPSSFFIAFAEGIARSSSDGFSDGSIKSVRGKPLAQNPNRDPDQGIDKTQNRLVPSRLRAQRCGYQDNCGRNPRRDNVLLSTQKYHYDRAEADHDCHAQTVNGKIKR